MIFAAGLGTRLRPLTDTMPKALVKVGGVPMLQRVILNLKKAGCDRILVNVHHFPDMIIDFLNSMQNFGIDIAVSDERDRLLDTGGGIAKAAKWLDVDEPFIVHNADILTTLDLKTIYERHEASKSEATLLVSARTTSRYLLFDDRMRMNGWINDSTKEVKPAGLPYETLDKYAFNGIHVISPSLLPAITAYKEKDEPFSIMEFYINSCRERSITGYLPTADYSWFDIGKPVSLAQAESYLPTLENSTQ